MTPSNDDYVDQLNEGIVLFDADLRVQLSNRRARDELRLSVEALRTGMPLRRFLEEAARGARLPDDFDPGRMERLVAAAAPGDDVPLTPEAAFRRLPGGGALLLIADPAQTMLQQRCADYVEAFEHLPHGVTMLDATLNLVICNQRFNQLMDIPSQLGRPGTSFEAFMRYNAQRGEYGPGEVDQLVRERVEQAARRESHRFVRQRPGGQFIEVQGIRMPRGGFVSSYTDVTAQCLAEATLLELQKAQESLIESRTRDLRQRERELADKTALLETTLEHMDQGITMFNADLVLVVCNSKVREMLGFPAEVCRVGATFEALTRYNAERGEYGPGDVDEQVRQRVALAHSPQYHCFERDRPDGRVIEIRGMPLASGGFVSIYTDVTARREAELRLREALDEMERRVEERTRSLRQREAELARKTALLEATVENISQGISMFDGDLKLLVHNRQFLELLDFPAELGQEGTCLERLFRVNAERGEYGPGDAAEQVAQRLEMARHPTPHKFRRQRPDGTVLEVQGTPLPAEIGGFVTTYADVTELVRAREHAETALAELKTAQEQLVQAEKMASLGQLVAGVAHEINTPIGVALTAATHLTEETGRLEALLGNGTLKRSDLGHYTTTAADSTRLIQANLFRADELIQSFKRVAVDQTSAERRRFNLGAYIGEVLRSLRPELKKVPHRIAIDCPPELELDSYPGALSHVLTNLLVNALVHAFDGINPLTILIRATSQEDKVLMDFSDDGRGVPSEHIGRIFDPFFTTRSGHGGSGLGLNVVFNAITTTLGGNIECTSTPGSGTLFRMRFPRTAATTGDRATPPAQP